MCPRAKFQRTKLCIQKAKETNDHRSSHIDYRSNRNTYEWKRSNIEWADGFEYTRWNIQYITSMLNNSIDSNCTIEFLIGTIDEAS
jgi:hypothetical protein